MANYLIAYGGTGQHAALAYARLCFLCKDIVDTLDVSGKGQLPFFYVFDKDVGAGDGDSKTAGTLLFDYAKRLSNNADIKAIDPIPKVEATENVLTLNDLLKSSPEIAQVLYTNDQLNVQVVHGNFGQPAVGASGLYIKQFDTIKRGAGEVNKDAAFANLHAGIQNAGGQKIAHVGSAIGGTGSGVMPASVSYFTGLHGENNHFTLPVLEWFKLVGAGKSEQDAAGRNNLIRQNRSSGLHFYLHNLQNISSVLPLGYSKERLEGNDCQRLWQGDYNQSAKESAIHLAAALAIWEFYFSEQMIQKGMYSFVTDDNQHISDISKLSDYTLGSLLAANLKLISEVGHVCNLLKNPPMADYVLFPYLKAKLSVSALRRIPRSKWGHIADTLEASIRPKIDAVEWLKNLDFVNQTLKTVQEKSLFQGINNFGDLFPKEAMNENISSAIYSYLLGRAKSRLQSFTNNPNDNILTSGKRLLPGYALEGTNPSPALKGTLAPITDPNHIKRLYRTGEIAAESVPSPFGAIHIINLDIEERISIIDNPSRNDVSLEEDDDFMQTNAQRRKLLFERYLLLFKGLIAGKVTLQKRLLWDEKENRTDKKSIGWAFGHLKGERMRYTELPEPNIYYLTFTTDKKQEVIVGATTPTICLFPSMSAEEDIWDAIDRSVKFIGNDVYSTLAQWCDYIKQRDGLNDHARPGWFRILWREVANYSGMFGNREIEAIKDDLPVFWGDKLVNIPIIRLKSEE